MERRGVVAVVVFAALAVLSGCTGVGIDVDAGGSTAARPDVANGTAVTVVDVVDGDTIDVRYPNGSTETVRLLGVDTPEVHADNDPAEYEGVPDTAAGATCLESAGGNASAFAERWLSGAQVTVVTDPAADRRGSYGRLLAYVYVNASEREAVGDATGRVDFNHRLLTTGHARVYDSTFSHSKRYYDAESDAQSEGRGLWACRNPDAAGPSSGDGAVAGGSDGPVATAASSGLTLEAVHADAAGNDHENLADEYLVFGNAADAPLPLGGWTVSDEGGHSYTVPDRFALQPGETVLRYTYR